MEFIALSNSSDIANSIVGINSKFDIKLNNCVNFEAQKVALKKGCFH